VGFDRWETYLESLRAEYHKQAPAERVYFFRDYGTFKDFVEKLPRSDRIPLLILAYERSRDVERSNNFDGDRHFLASAYGILTGRLLAAKLKPNGAEACVILGVACPLSGHGCNPLQPIEIAERAFRNRPYPADLFESARAYRETLEPLCTAQARKARKALDLLLWHDVLRPARTCWTSRIQRAIAAMKAEEAFAWQWLLRNSSAGMWNSGAGKAWQEEGKLRLATLGEDRFLERIDRWFLFSGEERVRLSTAGSYFLRLLILYGGLANPARALPILARLSAVHWSQREPMKKVMDGLARMMQARQPSA
jgi:hypothetical protein